MTIRMTEEQARAAGLLKSKPSSKKKGMGRGGAVTVCSACGERFTADAAETRHMVEAGHHRYHIPLEEA